MKNYFGIKDVFLVLTVVIGVCLLVVFLIAPAGVHGPPSFGLQGRPVASLQRADARSVARAVDEVNASFEESYQKSGLNAAPLVDELTVFRRAALGLSGTVPSVEEIREMEHVQPEERIGWLVSRLLDDQRTSGYLAERFARVFVGTEEGPFLLFRRRRFVDWLSEQISVNRPYDQLVRELLTDKGIWTDSPAVNFYTYNIVPGDQSAKPDPVRLAGRTSRAFLGMRIDCLQCHDDFLGNVNLGSTDDPVVGQQLDFHRLASFFGDVENSIVGIRDNSSSGVYQYLLLDATEETPISPQVPFNRNLDSATGDLRDRLARWITDPRNRPFARATVNRVWAILLGRGLVDPVDDIPLEGPFPPVLEILTDDFIQNGYDLHRLIRVIVLTKAFQRESSVDFEVTATHREQWAVFPLVRLRPEQVAGSVLQATSLMTIDSAAHILTRLAQFGQQNEFVNRYGDLGEEEFLERGETVTQRLLMLNGDMIDDRISNGLNSPSHVGFLSPTPEKAVETAYLSTLARLPSAVEMKHFQTQLVGLNGEAYNSKVRDIYWTLINSIEFVWNH